MENGFQGKTGQQVPFMSDEYAKSVSERYIELYEGITGEKFVRTDASEVLKRVEQNIMKFLAEKK
jgi:phosphoribosylaminoimidazole-succinocarboxamide synthase